MNNADKDVISRALAKAEDFLGESTPGPWHMAETWSFSFHSTVLTMDTLMNEEEDHIIMPQDEQGGPAWSNVNDIRLMILMRASMGYIVNKLREAKDSPEGDHAEEVRLAHMILAQDYAEKD